MSDRFSIMEEEILGQGAYLGGGFVRAFERARRSLGMDGPIDRVVLTGCGDSLFAGAAVRSVFGRISGFRSRVVAPIEIVRAGGEGFRGGVVLIAISVSGRSRRVVEAARIARLKGSVVVAVTNDPGSPIARVADRVVRIEGLLRHLETPSPGVLSYCGTLLSLIGVAAALCECHPEGAGGQLDVLKAELTAASGGIADLVASSRRAFSEWLGTMNESPPTLHWIGLGDDLASAGYARMKLLESAAEESIVADPEEWCHSHFFSAGSTSLLVVLSSSPAECRLFDGLLDAALGMGCNVVAVASGDLINHSRFSDSKRYRGVEVSAISSVSAPFLLAVPGQVYALLRGRASGNMPFGFDDTRRKSVNFRTVYEMDDDPSA